SVASPERRSWISRVTEPSCTITHVPPDQSDAADSRPRTGPTPGFINTPAADPTAGFGFFGPAATELIRRNSRLGFPPAIVFSGHVGDRRIPDISISPESCRVGRPGVDCLPISPAAWVATQDHDEAGAGAAADAWERIAYDDDARDQSTETGSPRHAARARR